MRYLVMVAQETTDGALATSVAAHETARAAYSAYYSELASAYASDALAADTVAIVGTDGHVYAIERVAGE